MDTPEDAAREQWYSDLVNEVSEQAIGEFTLERLRSYYVANRSVAKNALALFKEAESLLHISPSAALVLFTTAIEVGLKVTLLKPVVALHVNLDKMPELRRETVTA